MKRIFTILILATSVTAMAQSPNGHVALTLSGTNNLGFTGAQYGALAGFDVRAGKFAFSADGTVKHVRKSVGGSGYEANIEADGAYYLTPKIAIQANAVFDHYAVRQFSKSATFLGGGLRFSARQGQVITDFSGLHEVSGISGQSIGRARITGYAKHHLFLRGTVAVSRYHSGGQSLTGASFTGAIGFYFGGN